MPTIGKTKNGMLSSKLFDSKIKSANVQRSERWLGFFVGPAITMMVYYSMSGTYLNVFYTDVLKLSAVGGGIFLMLMPIISKVVDAITNIIMGRIIDKTRSRQGKARPWLLLAAPLMAISGILLYAVPTASLRVQLVWVVVSYNLYFAFAFTMFNMGNTLLIPLSTRNTKQRDGLALVNNMGVSMIPGLLVNLLFPALVLPLIGVNQGRWITVMSVLSVLVLPAVLVQYYHTRERVTEESVALQKEATHSIKQQLKACLSSRYWVIIMVVTVLFQLLSNLQNISIVYYSNWVLGTYNDGITMTIINAVGQAPLGLGVFILWPLCKRFGKRNVMMIGYTFSALGCAICLLQPRNMGVVLAGLVIKSFGYLPSYMMMAMLSDTLDHIEYKNGFRCDGLSASIYSLIAVVSIGMGQGLFNFGLSAFGYVPPAADGTWAVQSTAMQSFFVWSFIGIPMVCLLLIAILMIFFTVEKLAPQIQAGILAAHKAQAEARGEIYVSSEEKAQQEQETLDRQAEEKRIEELKSRCAKKGLSFEAEEAKYQEKLARRQARTNRKK